LVKTQYSTAGDQRLTAEQIDIVLFRLRRGAPSLRAFRAGRGFTINVLRADQECISRSPLLFHRSRYPRAL
jgi:flavin reductase (DIM6/NTAB) family NADH-FMN oxidoreductase RutF